jgi:16S rRNA (cytidine1402-2'-O)-methyltransferase
MTEEISKRGTLYIVATPIGNLGDMTFRAVEILKSVDLIACEDTRVSGQMLKHFGVEKPLVSFFQHSKLSKIDYIIEELMRGRNIALITDAGTPGISDPGQVLIYQIQQLLADKQSEGTGIKIIPIPGASAVAAAASIAGMIQKEFFFAGFLPKKKGRQTEFKFFNTLKCPIIVYESALRIEKTLQDIQGYMGEKTKVFIAREMTKMFEEYWGGEVETVLAELKKHQLKGEIVLIIQKTK